MANFNNFNDIKKYIDTSISSAQLPDKIRGMVSYSAPFSPTAYTGSHKGFKAEEVWFNTSNNVYYEFNGSSWITGGNIVPKEGDYIYTDNFLEEINTPMELSLSAQVLWSKVLGTEVMGWKLIVDNFYSPDNVSLNLDASGRVRLATQLMRNISALSREHNGHMAGLINIPSTSSDAVEIIPVGDFLKSRGKQTLYAPLSDLGETLNVEVFGGGSFVIGKTSSNNDPYISLNKNTGTYSSTIPKLLIRTQLNQNRILWEQKELNSDLVYDIGGGVSLVTDSSSQYPSVDRGRNLGKPQFRFDSIFAHRLNNGADLIIPTTGGTLARTADIPSSLPSPQSLVIKLNGGTVEDSNLYTYKGNVAKTVNITPASIGASPDNHSHPIYLLKAGDFMTGDIFHNNSSRSVWATGQGESTKQGEISASTGIFSIKAVTDLRLSGAGKEVSLNGTRFSPSVNNQLDLGTASTRWKDLFVTHANINNNLDVGTTLSVGGTITDNRLTTPSKQLINSSGGKTIYVSNPQAITVIEGVSLHFNTKEVATQEWVNNQNFGGDIDTSQFVNLTGTQTIKGVKTFQTNLLKLYSAGNNEDMTVRLGDEDSIFGFELKYLGSGSGNNNDLILRADNQNGPSKEVFRIKQDAKLDFKTSPTINGVNIATEKWVTSNTRSSSWTPTWDQVSGKPSFAPSNAQKNSDITKAEIEAKLTGSITSHTHNYRPAGNVPWTEVSDKPYIPDISTDNVAKFNNLISGSYNLPYYTSIVVKGDSNKYYPVHIASGNQNLMRTIKIWRWYSEQAPNDWYTSTHKGSLNLEWKGNFGSWGGAVYTQWIYENTSEYTKLLAETQLVDNCYAMAFFLRGGGSGGAIYHIASDQPLSWGGHPYLTYDKPTAFYNQDLTFNNPDHARYASAPRTTVNTSQLDSITVVKGNDSRLTNARPASSVSLSTISADTINTKTTGNAIMRYNEGKVKIGSSALPLQLDSSRDIIFKSGTYDAIEISDGGANGRNFIIGAGGNLLIGSGESNNILKTNYPSTGENMVVGGDNQIDLISNLQNGWGGRRTLQWSDGKLTIDAHTGNGTFLSKYNNQISITTPSGTVDIGPRDANRTHIWVRGDTGDPDYGASVQGKKPFEFNRSIYVLGEVFSNGNKLAEESIMNTTINTAINNKISLKSNTDNRDIKNIPNDYNGVFEIKGLKSNSSLGITGQGNYSAVMGIRGWSDSSGGDAHEFALGSGGDIYHRSGLTTTWNSWSKIYTEKNLSFTRKGTELIITR